MKHTLKAIKITLSGMVFIPIVTTLIAISFPCVIWNSFKEKKQSENKKQRGKYV